MTDKIIFDNIKKVHFIGIGGSGMFPLAQILQSKGIEISGSDINESYITELEQNLGMKVIIGQSPNNILGSDLIVYSAAIMENNVELIAAQKSGITVMKRSQLLGMLASEKDDCIGVCGTHGKTTTSAMITHILLYLEKDPSVIIGGKLKEMGGNGRVGKSNIMVCESCEYMDTFLNIYPKIAVILNIDKDHMEYFQTLDHVINSYHQFCENTSDIIIFNGDDLNTQKTIKNIKKELISFGLDKENDYYIRNINFQGYKNNTFDIFAKGNKIVGITLNIPGIHNSLNCLAAFIACLKLGIKPTEISQAIETFEGVSRRFEILGNCHGATIGDDYAHHPKEIEITIKTAKKLKFERVRVIFQPFTFSRTHLLFNDFIKSLSLADEVILTPIMGAREINTYNIFSQDLAKKIKKSKFFETFDLVANYIKETAIPNELVLTMGCGDIYKCADKILY